MNKKIVLLLGLLLIFTIMLTGCFENKPETVVSGDSDSGEIVFVDENAPTYGNGTDIVLYKGNIYYIEYRNNDFSDEAVTSAKYGLISDSNNQRYINVIDGKGKVKNLFKITGSTFFGIIDDRFFLKSNLGSLYTVDMKGENSIELVRGDIVDIDEVGHAVYYTKEDVKDSIYRFDTKDLSIKSIPFNNPLDDARYSFLKIVNGVGMYSFFDDKKGELSFYKYDINSQKLTEVKKLEIGLMYKEQDYIEEREKDYVYYTSTTPNYGAVVVVYPCSGTIGGFYEFKVYIFDYKKDDIELAFDTTTLKKSEGGSNYWFDFIYDKVQSKLYNLEFNKDMINVDSLLDQKTINDFAMRYNIDLEAKLGDEAKQSMSLGAESDKYEIGMENFVVVGDKIFYKITASRLNPAGEIGWRPGFLRIASEVYLYDLGTNKKQLIYQYVNSNYDEKIKEILENKDLDGSGEDITNIDDNEELRPDEMYLDIKLDDIWKKDFDVRVEEVGGTIFGTRIEYEGHHTKDEGTIRIKVNREVGAMLTVFIDGDRHSQMVIE